MSKDKVETISCPRFGGCRIPHSCIVFDRYKSCRKNCGDLKKYMESHPNAKEDAEKIIDKSKARLLPHVHAGKGLPLAEHPEFVCDICKYEAKSTRGLRAHRTRTHGIKKPRKVKKKRKAK